MPEISILREAPLPRRVAKQPSEHSWLLTILQKALVALLLWTAGEGLVQAQTAELTAYVTDETRVPLQAAVVTLRDEARGWSSRASTDAAGRCTLVGLSPSRYSLTVELAGFASFTSRDLLLTVNERASVDVRLTVSTVTELVEVAGTTRRIDGSIGTVVGRELVERLPLNGRSFLPLIALTPGVRLTAATFANEGQFTVNGQRPDANYLSIDGVSANMGVSGGVGMNASGGGSLPAVAANGSMSNLISLEAMEEFRLETSGFAPEFGRTPGGQVSIVSRSGSNRYSGSAYEFYRNDAFDANDWFSNRSGLAKAKLSQHDVGGVLGGPLRRDRMFFFVSGERLRLSQPRAGVMSVPGMSLRTNAPPAIRPLLDAFPLPTGPDTSNGQATYAYSLSDVSRLDAISGKVDMDLAGSRLFVRATHSPSTNVQRLVATDRLVDTKTTTATAGLNTVYRGAAIDVRANMSTQQVTSEQVFAARDGSQPPGTSEILPPFAHLDDAIFQLTVPGGTYAPGRNVRNQEDQVNITATVTRPAGSHLFKAGIDWRRLVPHSGPRSYYEVLRFNSVADVLAGQISRFEVDAFTSSEFTAHNVGLFAQDTWNLWSSTTVTYGLRWDIEPSPGMSAAGSAPAAINFENPATIDLAPAGTPLWRTRYDNLAPRLGISHRLRADGRTIVRGGVGRYYDLAIKGAGAMFGVTFPFAATRVLTNVPTPIAANLLTPPVLDRTTKPYNAIIQLVDPHLRAPRSTQWNVTVDQALFGVQSATLSYVGARGHRMLRLEDWLAPNAYMTELRLVGNNGHSDYDGLQLEFKRRASHGIGAQASYALGRSRDTESNVTFALPTPFVGQNRDYGPSDYDIRHTLSAALTLDLDTIVPHGLHGWTLDAIWQARSGAPVNVLTGVDVLGVQRPDLIPGVPLYVSDPTVPGGQRLNRLAFQSPPAGMQGTLPRNALRGFWANQLDLSLAKRVHIVERLGLDLRLDCFNVLNHANFATPTASLANANFGMSTQMLNRQLGQSGSSGGFSSLYQIGGPRSMQLSVKARF
jgi:hypothetical protein